MEDVVTADFKGKCRRGIIINSPMTQIKTYASDSPAHADYDALSIYNVRWRYEDYRLSAAPLATVLPELSVDSESLVQQAAVAAKSRIENSDVNILATLWEADESIALIVSLLWRVYKIARAVRKLDYKYLRKQISFRELQDRYMEARYGLRPMYYDAIGLHKALTGQERPERKTFRGSAIGYDEKTFSGTNHDNNTGLYWHYSGSISKEIKVRCGVLCHLEPTSLLDRFGVFDIAEAAWDVIPFSFILDWFLNVGNLIAAWTPEKGVRELASWTVVTETTFTTCKTYAELTPYWKSGVMTDATPGSFSSVVIKKSRIPEINLGVLPTVKVELNPLKLLDLGIILNKMRKHRSVPVQV